MAARVAVDHAASAGAPWRSGLFLLRPALPQPSGPVAPSSIGCQTEKKRAMAAAVAALGFRGPLAAPGRSAGFASK